MLWLVVGCFVVAFMVPALAPFLLTVGRWQLLHPRTALTVWFGAFFTGGAFVLAAIVISVAAAASAPASIEGAESIVVTILAWLGLSSFGAILAFVAVSTEPLVAQQKDAVLSLSPVARSREARGAFTLVRFDSPEAKAFAIPGRHPEIFVSSNLEAVLSPVQLEAVLAHEYAHLRHFHGWALRIASINAMCLGRLRPGQALHRATLLLVELAADDAAARQAGAANLANALSTLAHTTGDEGMNLRAERLTDKKWPKASRRRLPKAIASTTLS